MARRFRSTITLLTILSLAVVLAPAITGSNISIVSRHDLKVVKRAYMTLSTLNRLNRYETAYSSTRSRDEARKATFLTFQVTSVRSGPIAEILNDRLYNLVSPRGGDVMSVVRTTHHLNDDPVKFVSFNVYWKSEPHPPTDPRTVLEVLGNTINAAGHSRYLLYEVIARDGVKSRTYRAMALFAGLVEDGVAGNIALIDNVVESNSLGLALTEDGLPLRVPFMKFVETQQYRDLVNRARQGRSIRDYQLQSLMRRVSLSSTANPRSLQAYNCPPGYWPDSSYGMCCNDATMRCCFPYESTGICGTDEYDVYCPCESFGGGGDERGGVATLPLVHSLMIGRIPHTRTGAT